MRVGLQTQGRSDLTELARRVDEEANAILDYEASTEVLTVANGNQLLIDGIGFFPITPRVSQQIATACEIPYRYYKKMQIEAPELLQKNTKTWFNKNPKKRLVRTLKKIGLNEAHVRAMLSMRFEIGLSNAQVLKMIIPLIHERNLWVMSSGLTGGRIRLCCFDPTLTGMVDWDGKKDIMGRAKKDEIIGGVEITNSEVGAGALQVKSMTLASWCSNGMVTGKEFRRYHVGKTLESDNNKIVYTNETRKATYDATFLKLRDTVNHAMSEATLLETLKKYDEAVTKDFKDPIKTVEKLAKHLGTSENEKSSILDYLKNSEAYNQWSLANAVTATAENVASYDRSGEMETMGMEVIDLSPSQWNEIAV